MRSFQRSKATGATSVIDYLHRQDGAAGLLPAAQRILRLREDLLALVPAGLRESCDVARFDDETVVVRVASAGAAAKLRQTVPRLRAGLIDRGWKVSAIRMRVQPRLSDPRAMAWAAPSPTSIPPKAVAAFAALNRDLEDSPLKAAVERLVRRRAPAR